MSSFIFSRRVRSLDWPAFIDAVLSYHANMKISDFISTLMQTGAGVPSHASRDERMAGRRVQRPFVRRWLARALAICFASHVAATYALEEVPFVTSPDNVTLAMLEMAKVGPRDVLIDLGSGDGRIVIVAAKRFGARGLGVEIDPRLLAQSKENARQAGVESLARFAEQDLFDTDLSKATVITLYLLPDVNLALRPRLLALKPGTRVVSHDWDMRDWAPDRTVQLSVPDKRVGKEKSSKVHLWIVPAQLGGRWCAAGAGAAGDELMVNQTFQKVSGEWTQAGIRTSIEGRIDGATLDIAASDTGTAASGPTRLRFALAGDRLQAVAVAESDSSPSGSANVERARTVFERSASGRCG